MKLLNGLNNRIDRIKKLPINRNSIIDLFWARIENLEPSKNQDENITLEKLDNEYLALVQKNLTEELNTEVERSKILDGKLQGLLSLVSIGMGIITLFIAFVVKDFNPNKFSQFEKFILFVEFSFISYIALQVLRCLVATIKGLGTREYRWFVAKEFIPKKKEEIIIYQQRIIQETLTIISDNKIANNLKANELKLGHVAVRNSIWALFIMILTIIIFKMLQMFC